MSEETVAMPVVRCLRCGAEYVARSAKLPKTCARCRSKVWMKKPEPKKPKEPESEVRQSQ